VRASATSRAASSASIHASQAKDKSAPANEASPFALLVGTVAPKDGVKDAKASQKDNSQDSKDPSGDKSAMDTGSQQDANTTQNVSQPPAKSAAKTDKTEKSNNEKQEVLAETDEETPDESQVAAATLQLLSLQNLPPQPPVQVPVANPSSDSNDDLTVGAAAPAAQTAPSADLQPATSAADTPASALQPAAVQDDQQDDEAVVAAGTQTPLPAPQSRAPQPEIDPAQPGKPVAKSQTAAVKTASDPAPQPAGDDTAPQENIAATAADTPKGNTAPKTATNKSDTVKAPKTDIAKGRFAQDTKTDPNKGDTDKIAQLTAAAPPADADEISDTPKPAPQPVQALSHNPLINPNTPAGNVPANPIAVAHVTQHLQVTAAPNLPALAVEIAAKSQSGAKQFDIRLDPPELGRVEVRLSIDATGKASAHLSADQPQTLSLLQKDASVLTRALRDAGLDVSQDGLNFSLRQQNDNNQSGNAGSGNRRSRNFSLSATTSVDATAMTAAYRGPANGRLDIRV